MRRTRRPWAPLIVVALLTSCSSGGDTKPGATLADASDSDAASGPSLATLAVSPLTLTPAFEPSIHDYYVRCASGHNALTVSMTGANGATASIAQPVVSGPTLPASLDVNENEAVVAVATSGSARTSYWIRCLPEDFPVVTVSKPAGADTPPPGYVLVGNGLHVSSESGYAIVLDGNDVPVWYHTTKTGGGAVDVDSLADDTVSFVPYLEYTFAAGTASFEVHSLDPSGVTYVRPNGAPLDFHELRRLANGDSLVFTWPVTTGVDLTGLGSFGDDEDIVNCDIQELDPSGKAVWSWSATDHLDPVKDCTYPETVPVLEASGTPKAVVDPFHCNSIDVAENGDLLVSARNIDSIFMVSKATGAILWKMGGSSYTKDGAPFLRVVDDTMNGFYRQHDARLQPDGTLSLFDDETAMPGPARALVLSYDLTAKTASIVWQYEGKETAQGVGSFRILPDGSRVIGWGLGLGSNPTFSEVGSKGATLREVTLVGDFSFRAIKVPLSGLDLDLMRATAGAKD